MDAVGTEATTTVEQLVRADREEVKRLDAAIALLKSRLYSNDCITHGEIRGYCQTLPDGRHIYRRHDGMYSLDFYGAENDLQVLQRDRADAANRIMRARYACAQANEGGI